MRACRVYGISLSAVIDRVVNVRAMANLAHCMAKVLKERHPGCAIVFGGLQIAPNTLHRQYYREFMEACRELDYCYVGKSGIAAVQLLRNIVNGEHDRCGGIPNVVYRDATGGVRFGESGSVTLVASGAGSVGGGTGSDFAPPPKTSGMPNCTSAITHQIPRSEIVRSRIAWTPKRHRCSSAGEVSQS